MPFGSYEIGADFLSSSCLGISCMLAGCFSWLSSLVPSGFSRFTCSLWGRRVVDDTGWLDGRVVDGWIEGKMVDGWLDGRVVDGWIEGRLVVDSWLAGRVVDGWLEGRVVDCGWLEVVCWTNGTLLGKGRVISGFKELTEGILSVFEAVGNLGWRIFLFALGEEIKEIKERSAGFSTSFVKAGKVKSSWRNDISFSLVWIAACKEPNFDKGSFPPFAICDETPCFPFLFFISSTRCNNSNVFEWILSSLDNLDWFAVVWINEVFLSVPWMNDLGVVWLSVWIERCDGGVSGIIVDVCRIEDGVDWCGFSITGSGVGLDGVEGGGAERGCFGRVVWGVERGCFGRVVVWGVEVDLSGCKEDGNGFDDSECKVDIDLTGCVDTGCVLIEWGLVELIVEGCDLGCSLIECEETWDDCVGWIEGVEDLSVEVIGCFKGICEIGLFIWGISFCEGSGFDDERDGIVWDEGTEEGSWTGGICEWDDLGGVEGVLSVWDDLGGVEGVLSVWDDLGGVEGVVFIWDDLGGVEGVLFIWDDLEVTTLSSTPCSTSISPVFPFFSSIFTSTCFKLSLSSFFTLIEWVFDCLVAFCFFCFHSSYYFIRYTDNS